MNTVTVSPKYQVVIPKNIRDDLQLHPGQKMKIIAYDGRIELIPDKDICELKGFLNGEVGPKQVSPPRIFDQDIHTLMDQVEVIAASVLQERFPREALAEVQIETKQGKIFKSGIMAARWEPASGLPTDPELIDKFHWLAAPIVGGSRAQEIRALIWRLETVADLRRLIRLCG